jgi:hypothetical protein
MPDLSDVDELIASLPSEDELLAMVASLPSVEELLARIPSLDQVLADFEHACRDAAL